MKYSIPYKLKWCIPFIMGMIQLIDLHAQSINSPITVYYQGKVLEFNYSGGTGSPTDWIGIYHHGEVPGRIASTSWQYISSSSGKIFFDGNLDIGKYDVHLFCCDGYTILASFLNFEIKAVELKSYLTYYKASDSIRIIIAHQSRNDRLKIYAQADLINGLPGENSNPIFSKTFSDSGTQIRHTIAPWSKPGQYVAFQSDPSGAIKSFDDFEVRKNTDLPNTITRIGLGSCSSQQSAQPVLNHIVQRGIDAFIYMGDNVYIDTYDTTVMAKSYEAMLSTRTEVQNLRSSVPLLATWDDHDYGCCDEDVDYPFKSQSQKIFLDYFEEPLNSPRRKHTGIYTAYSIGPAGKKLQIILLDTRYFLDNKRRNTNCGKNDYCAWAGPSDINKTMLGTEQWDWLRKILLEKADLRLIVSSVQFSSSYHGFEGWSLFPYERKKMIELIKQTNAEHIIFASGDMHYSEVSKFEVDTSCYPIFDFTSSGINTAWPPEDNDNRVSSLAYGSPNAGILSIDWDSHNVNCTTIDQLGRERFSYSIPFHQLEFNKGNTVSNVHSSGAIALKIVQIPTPGYQTAQLYFNQMTSGTIAVFDASGRLISQKKLVNKSEFKVEGLIPGLYIVKFNANWAKTEILKVLIH